MKTYYSPLVLKEKKGEPLTNCSKNVFNCFSLVHIVFIKVYIKSVKKSKWGKVLKNTEIVDDENWAGR